MRREEVLAALRALKEPAGERFRRALAAIRRFARPQGRDLILRAWAAARRRPDALLAAALVMGVVAMILHWS